MRSGVDSEGNRRGEMGMSESMSGMVIPIGCRVLVTLFVLGLVLGRYVEGGKCMIEPPPSATPLAEKFPCTMFNRGFANIWASDHQTISDDQLHVKIQIDNSSGTGFKTKTTFVYGFFSAGIKLPPQDYSAGIITTFYTSNAELYPNAHDEIDFEFLGRNRGDSYVLQTNVYANGSTNTGREQRLSLWFDPTMDYHDYSILWTSQHIVLYIDDIPIREFPYLGKKVEFPAKPMYLYATIWDGSDWATGGGKFRANYSYGPFVASYSNFIVNGCPMTQDSKGNNVKPVGPCATEFTHIIPPSLSDKQKESINWVKKNYMTYDYCQDTQRYPTPLPECSTQNKPSPHKQSSEGEATAKSEL